MTVLSVNFGEVKTWRILFSKTKRLSKLNLSYGDHIIKQYHTVEYLGCHLDSDLNGEPLTMKVLKKSKCKVKFFQRQNKYLAPTLK